MTPSEYEKEILRLSRMSERQARAAIEAHEWCMYEHSALRVLEHSRYWREAWPRPREKDTRVTMLCRGAKVAMMLDTNREIMRQRDEIYGPPSHLRVDKT